MKPRIISVLVLASLAVSLTASGVSADWRTGRAKDTSITVFAATDKKSDESGIGVALSKYDRGVTDLSFTDFGEFRLAQFSKLNPRQIGPYVAYLGFAVAYADPDDDTTADVPDDMLYGLQLVLGKIDLSYDLSLDLRMSSLTEDFDPIGWFTQPDLLSLGAGLSYSF